MPLFRTNGEWACIFIGLFQSTPRALHLSNSPIHTHFHTVMVEAAIQGANCSS